MNVGLKILEWAGLYQSLDYDHKRFDRSAQRLESPVEKIFWSCGYFELSKYGQITPQVNVCGYRVDFAYFVDDQKIAIEIDGFDYHSSKAQMTRDYQRQRHLEANEWRVIRFTGSEVYGDAQACVAEVIRLAGVR
jgi:very-short-patch-repair endonuclease